uniref:Uncharacterized protein n=1 Tax=Plectus sambesii TaxID=2011161 RepID=A0A914XL63_9BILA
MLVASAGDCADFRPVFVSLSGERSRILRARPPGAAKTHTDFCFVPLTQWWWWWRPVAIATGGHFTAERTSKKHDGSQLAPSHEAAVVVLVFLLAVYSPRRDVPATRPLTAARGGPIVVASLFGRVAVDPPLSPSSDDTGVQWWVADGPCCCFMWTFPFEISSIPTWDAAAFCERSIIAADILSRFVLCAMAHRSGKSSTMTVYGGQRISLADADFTPLVVTAVVNWRVRPLMDGAESGGGGELGGQRVVLAVKPAIRLRAALVVGPMALFASGFGSLMVMVT